MEDHKQSFAKYYDNSRITAKKIYPSKKMMRYFELAKNMAMKAPGRFKHGCCLVSGGAVINAAHNSNRVCSFGARFRKKEFGTATLHSEIATLLNIDRKNTHNSDLYVVRVNSCGEWRQSSPCQMCLQAAIFTGVKRIFYSTEDGFEVIKVN